MTQYMYSVDIYSSSLFTDTEKCKLNNQNFIKPYLNLTNGVAHLVTIEKYCVKDLETCVIIDHYGIMYVGYIQMNTNYSVFSC